jgi:hypothetical protein
VVTAHNEQNDAADQSQHKLAIDPSRMSSIDHTADTSWMALRKFRLVAHRRAGLVSRARALFGSHRDRLDCGADLNLRIP